MLKLFYFMQKYLKTTHFKVSQEKKNAKIGLRRNTKNEIFSKILKIRKSKPNSTVNLVLSSSMRTSHARRPLHTQCELSRTNQGLLRWDLPPVHVRKRKTDRNWRRSLPPKFSLARKWGGTKMYENGPKMCARLAKVASPTHEISSLENKNLELNPFQDLCQSFSKIFFSIFWLFWNF